MVLFVVKFCGGSAGLQCPSGLVCVDDPRDDCAPPTGADCGGICVPPSFVPTRTPTTKKPTTAKPTPTNSPVTSFPAKCCDPLKEPGKFGNPFCFEGAGCCPSGKWTCSIGDGRSFSCDGKIVINPPLNRCRCM